MEFRDPFADPADDWDENDGYEYDDTKPDFRPVALAPAVDLDEADYMNRPDYIGIVSGAQYKLENADGVSEYALIVVDADATLLFEMSDVDLRYLARQIRGLIDED